MSAHVTGSDHAYHFDLNGTLVELTVPFERIVADAAEAAGAKNVSAAAFAEVLGHTLYQEGDPIRCAAKRAFPEADSETFRETFIAKEVAATTALPGAVSVLKTLHRYHLIGVLTNGVGELQREKLRATGLRDYVDDIVVSGDVGRGKPDADIYRIAEERLPADRRTFVADDLERDLKPARRLGWEVIHLGDIDTEVGVRCIDTLTALLD